MTELFIGAIQPLILLLAFSTGLMGSGLTCWINAQVGQCVKGLTVLVEIKAVGSSGCSWSSFTVQRPM